MKPMNRAAAAGRRQQGIVMLMTLILLAVMALGTAMAVKVSMNTDMVAHNMRNRQLAFQAAEVALRYCENMVINDPTGTRMLVNYRRSQNNEWLVQANWDTTAADSKVHIVPLTTIGMPNTIRVEPQCLIRHFTIDEWREVSPPVPGTVTAESRGFNSAHLMFYRITVKGFSPDYKAPPKLASGGFDFQNTRGSEVMLQSMIRSIQ